MSLADALRGARIIRRDEARDLTLIWYGGHWIHAFDADGCEVAFWSIGNFSHEQARETKVLEAMQEAITTGEYGYSWTD